MCGRYSLAAPGDTLAQLRSRFPLGESVEIRRRYNVCPGDEVVFLGSQGDKSIDAREMADWIGTIPYEILCRLGARVERKYDGR